MKTILINTSIKISLFLFLILLTLKSSAQVTDYNCYIKNITTVDPNTKTFEIWIENTGTNSINLTAFQAGINFNYAALANGGTITGLGVSPPSPGNWSIDPTSKQIRMTSVFGMPGLSIPGSPGIKIAKFKLVNTAVFSNVLPVFTWSFLPTNSTITQTIFLCSENGVQTSTNITNPAKHLVIGNSVPTLSEWALILFAIFLTGTSIFFITNKK